MVGRPSRESIQHSLGLVSGFIASVAEEYSIDPKRFYVGGFSMGGAMAAATLLTLPDLVAGGLVLSGYVPLHSGLEWRLQDVAGKPLFQAHGTLDDVLPIQYGRMSRDFLAGTPVELTYREYPIGHTVAPVELADAAAWMRGTLDREQAPR
jgi:phospholipase/carboxylesterase